MDNKNTTIELFDKYAGDYDILQAAVVPIYNDVLSIISETFRHYVGGGTFLDLGCGTGNITYDILKEYPDSKVYLLDGSLSMIDIAVGKVTGKIGKQAILGNKAVNLEDSNWDSGIDHQFDAVITAFVLEHLKEANYREVISKVYKLLKPGGVFITLEVGDNDYGMKDWFMDQMQRKIDQHQEFRHIIEEAKQSEQHYFVNIKDKIHWLKDADFGNIHTVWQHLFAYLIVAEKTEY